MSLIENKVDLHDVIGLGVAGNFAGHLEQAGEQADFTNVQVAEDIAPKGIFPFYLPSKGTSQLEQFPLSSEFIIAPSDQKNIQIEPEVALLCKLEYKAEEVVAIIPQQFGAYNDCSIRKPNAKKISDKKNWGSSSKGLSARLITIDSFAKGGIMDNYRIACYLGRAGKLHEYGINSPVLGYSYFYEKLINWMLIKMNGQVDDGPLESISDLLKQCAFPEYALISIGATKYTEFGQTNYLQTGDKIYVIVYDSSIHANHSLDRLIHEDKLNSEGISALIQKVV